jgi:hypothetical protein
MDDYSGAMQYMSEVGIDDPRQRREIFMTYHTKIIHVNPVNSILFNVNRTENVQLMLPLLEGFKGFPASLIGWNNESIGGLPFLGYLISTQEFHFSDPNYSTTNSNGLLYVQTPDNPEYYTPDSDDEIALQFEQIVRPFRWKNPSGNFVKWTDDPNHPGVDPFAVKYGLQIDDEQYATYKVLYVMFHEIGHAIDWYHMMFSAKTDVAKNTVIYVLQGQMFTGVPFSCSPAWTHDKGASDWEIKLHQTGFATWEPPQGLTLEKFYRLTGAATSCEGHDPPVSLRGADDPLEDFAECFALYMLNRNYFGEVFPMKYAALETYLKKIKDFRREVLSK